MAAQAPIITTALLRSDSVFVSAHVDISKQMSVETYNPRDKLSTTHAVDIQTDRRQMLTMTREVFLSPLNLYKPIAIAMRYIAA